MRKFRQTINSNSYLTQWTYNKADQPVTMTYPDGEIVTTGYNNLMQLVSLIGKSTYVSTSAYDSALEQSNASIETITVIDPRDPLFG